MPNKLADDRTAIGTSIFEHLLNPAVNTAEHIGRLLSALRDDAIGLITEAGRGSNAEYPRRFSTHKNIRDQDHLLYAEILVESGPHQAGGGRNQQDSLIFRRQKHTGLGTDI